jgi:hypothetical protein
MCADRALSNVRIIHVADLSGFSRCWARTRAFQDLGLDVRSVRMRAQGNPQTGGSRPSLPVRALGRFGVHLDWVGASRNVLGALAQAPADIVWVEKGTALNPADLRTIRRRYPQARLVNFSEDDMFLAHNRTPRYVQGLPLYDMVFTTKALNADPAELKALGARDVRFVYQAFDPYQHHPIELSADEARSLDADVSFVGSYEAARAASMLHLAQNGVVVRVWGDGWTGRAPVHPNLRIEGRAMVNLPGALNYTKAVAASRINLCFLRKLNRDQHTSRTFEIPAIGGFMLAERTPQHQALYAEDQEAAFFGDDDELLSKVRFYLADDEARQAMAAAGHRRCVENYGSLGQARAMLTQVLELDGGGPDTRP